MGEMRGKQRLLCAIQGGQPDRVPVLPQIWLDHAAIVSGIDPLEIMERPELGFRAMLMTARHYGLDGFRAFLIYPARRVERAGPTVYELDPETGERLGIVDMEGGWDLKPFVPPKLVHTLDDVSRIPVPSAQSYWDDGRCVHLQEIVQEAGEDHVVVGRVLAFATNWLFVQRGHERAMFDLYEEPRIAHAVLENGLHIAVEQMRAMRGAGVELFYIGDATASTDLISPRHFKEYVFPYYKAFCEEAHQLGGLVYVHVCGNQTPLAEMLADTGADCIEPMDPLGGVDPAYMKRLVGDRAALMGGVSTLTMLKGTPEQVEAEARECIRKAGHGGGYILAAGCMVPRDTPRENVRALVRAAREFGSYPLPQ